ncbi:MAG: DUF2182 domain-containing protein [Vicinamibacteria bacterium]
MWARAVLTVALRGPGKALLLASALGWIAMAWMLAGDGHPHAMSHAPDRFAAVWLAMILAMAPPMLLREIGRLWRASLRRLRGLTIAWFSGGYVAVWLAAGAGLGLLAEWVARGPQRITAAVALVALWQCSPARQRCLNSCHRPPTLRVFGAAAQWDALRYGISTGVTCAASCGPVMLLVLLVDGHHLAAMALATVVATLERYWHARSPGWRLPFSRGRSFGWLDPGPMVGRFAGS